MVLVPSYAVPDVFINSDCVYRAMTPGPNGLMACGFLRKPGRGPDHTAYDPPYWSVVWVLRGSGELVTADGRIWPLTAGDCFLRSPGHRHSNRLDPEGRWAECFLLAGPAQHQALVAAGLIDPARPVWHAGIDLALLRDIARLRDRLRDASDAELPRLWWQVVDLALVLLARGRSGGDDRSAAISEACRRLAREPMVPFALLAREAGLSPERFRKVFRNQVGIPPSRYRARCLIDLARRMLADPAWNVQRVAAKLGYASPFAFSAQFSREVGEPPSAFRRRHGG